MDDVAILIPARYASQRYPGKPLVPLTGATGARRSLIERSWRVARDTGAARVAVLTDDDRIEAAARDFGAEVLRTSDTCRNGTERCAEATAGLTPAPDIVVNLQGDAPLTRPGWVAALVDAMRADPGVAVATPVLRTAPDHLARLRADRRAGRVGATTAVFGASGNALYFSKEVLPFADRLAEEGRASVPVWHHVGLYAYRPAALARYVGWAPGDLETVEGLEQLRFLENGVPVRCVPVPAEGAFWELNNPDDVAVIEGIMAEEGLA